MMTPRHTHSAFLYYMALIISSGLFSFAWLISLMRDVNAICGKQQFNITRNAITIWTLLIVQVVSIFYLIIHLGDPTPSGQEFHLFISSFTIITNLSLVFYIIVVIVRIYRDVLMASGTPSHTKDILKIILLTFLMYLSLPYLQNKVNLLLEKR